jgi:putative Holliday junction resolvase
LTVLASRDEDALIKEILALVSQHKVERIVVGLPRQLSGDLGRQANKVTAFADKLAAQAKQDSFDELDMQLWDERLGGRRGGRDRKLSIRAEVDAIAAALILQGFLDSQHPDDAGES